jgi:hypothetical protein
MKHGLLLGLALLGICIAPGLASAGTLSLDFLPDNTWSGVKPGAGSSLNVTFTDNGDGSVKMVITSNLNSGENVATKNDGFYFNIDPSKTSELGHLTFALQSSVGTFTGTATASQSEDGFKADGDGFYDINLTWAKQGGFVNGQSQTYKITTDLGTISAADFNFSSTSSGNGLSFLAGVHIQNTPNGGNGSAWVSGTQGGGGGGGGLVPEPSTISLAGIGCVGLLGFWAVSRRRAVVA